MEKIVIIGAGPAGLTAGLELIKTKKYEVTIIESDNQVGGLSKTINYNGNRMDLGGHRFFSKSDIITNFWLELMPLQGYPSIDDIILNKDKDFKGKLDPEKTDSVMLLRDRVSRIYFRKRFFDYPVSFKIDTFKKMGLKNTILCGFSYIGSVFHKRKENSLENFYINRFGKKLYSMFFEKYTEKLWGRHPKDISPDWGGQRVKGLSLSTFIKNLFKKNNETSLIEEFYYPKLGPGQLFEKMAFEFNKLGGKIVLNSSVIKVLKENNKIIYVKCDDGKKYECDYILSSMPLKDLIISMNKVPDKIKTIAKGLPYRDFITIGVLLKELKIKDEKRINKLIPDCWMYIQEANVKMGRIQIFNNWSPYLVKDYKKTIWIGLEFFCNENDDFWNLSDSDRFELAIKELEKMGIANKGDVLDYHTEKVRKAYPAYFDSYSKIDKIINYLNKIDNLYCIGRNGQHRYNNMDHSMMTAIEAVNNITNGIKNKDNIWNVNTEQEYHESK